MKKLLTGVLCALTFLGTACDDDKQTTPDFDGWFSSLTVRVVPIVVEEVGSKVPVTIYITVSARVDVARGRSDSHARSSMGRRPA